MEPIQMKRCSRCKETKNIDEFYFNGRSKDQLSCWCKTCTERKPRYARLHYQGSPYAAGGQKWCYGCKQMLSVDQYHKNCATIDGLQKLCKHCSRAAREQNCKGSPENLKREQLRLQGLKICSKCQQIKPLAAFHKHSQCKDGLRPDCKVCKDLMDLSYLEAFPEQKRRRDGEYKAKTREHNLARRRERYQANPQKNRDRLLRNLYGMTLQEYNQKLSSQNNVCAICQRPEMLIEVRTGVPRYLAVDHNHKTGKVRGLLCHQCNSSLGSAHESIAILYKMIEYLKQYHTDN